MAKGKDAKPAKDPKDTKGKSSSSKPSKPSKDNAQEDTSASSSSKATAKSKLKPATAINVRHILLAKHSTKETALERLRNGEKFDEVARDMSEDKARQGGSLGWKTRGSLLQAFEEVAYGLEPSTTGNPKIGEVKTGEGYHVIMVEGRK